MNVCACMCVFYVYDGSVILYPLYFPRTPSSGLAEAGRRTREALWIIAFDQAVVLLPVASKLAWGPFGAFQQCWLSGAGRGHWVASQVSWEGGLI